VIYDSSNSSKWFVCPQVKPAAEMRLFLFPYAGAGPAVFKSWATDFPDNIETRIAHYPGRGSRHSEPLIKQVITLAEKFAPAVQLHSDKPFAFFGHSLGGLIAFELARYLRENNLPQPKILFVSACEAPHIPDSDPPIHALPDSEFLKSLQQLNGIPSELFDQPEMIQLLLPILRADFEAVESYVYTPGDSSLGCPIIAFGGLNDPRVRQERLEDWCLHTNSRFRSQYFSGDHFFINTNRESITASMIAEFVSTYARN